MSTQQTFPEAEVPVPARASEREAVGSEQDALDLTGDASHQSAQWVVVPIERFTDAFFQLHTRVAGFTVQKSLSHGTGPAVLGDISRHTTRVPRRGVSSGSPAGGGGRDGSPVAPRSCGNG